MAITRLQRSAEKTKIRVDGPPQLCISSLDTFLSCLHDLVEAEGIAYRITKGNLGIPGFPVNLVLYSLLRNKIRQKYSKTMFKKKSSLYIFFYFDHKAF